MEPVKVKENEWVYGTYKIICKQGSIGGARGPVYHVYDADGNYAAQVYKLDGSLGRAIKNYEHKKGEVTND